MLSEVLLLQLHLLHPVYTVATHQSVGCSCALGYPKVVLPSSVVEVELVDISETQVVHTTGHLQQQIQVKTALQGRLQSCDTPKCGQLDSCQNALS